MSIAILTPSLNGKPIPMWYEAISASSDKEKYTIYSTVGKSILEGRKLTTEKAFENPLYSHFLFLDDDILPPPIGIKQLLNTNLPIIGGVCCYKKFPYQGVFAFLDEATQMYQYDTKPKYGPKPFKVDATGMGCLLIKREVLEAIPVKDWFRWNWIRSKPNNKSYRFAGGEDIWWMEQAIKKGYQPYIHPQVRCLHVCRETGEIYPKSLNSKFWKRFD